MGERLLCKQNVAGSIPVTSTIYVNAGLLTAMDITGVISSAVVRFNSLIDTKMRLVMPCAVQAQAVTRTQKGEVDSCHLFGGLAQLGERLLCKQ